MLCFMFGRRRFKQTYRTVLAPRSAWVSGTSTAIQIQFTDQIIQLQKHRTDENMSEILAEIST